MRSIAAACASSSCPAPRLWFRVRWTGRRRAASDSIAAALAAARPGTNVLVEPGEYRERLVLTSGVRVISRIPRGATIRLPGTASEGDPAVVADGVSGAELAGFRIVGDAATPLGTGIFARNTDVSVVDVEVVGAANVAIDLSDDARATILASHIHDNPGAALAIRGGASPRVNRICSPNGLSERVGCRADRSARRAPDIFGNTSPVSPPTRFEFSATRPRRQWPATTGSPMRTNRRRDRRRFHAAGEVVDEHGFPQR